MMEFRDFADRRRSALFVATGSSNEFVRDWLPHFDTVAVHQQAVKAVPGPIDFMTCINWPPVMACQSEFERVHTFFVMDPLSENVEMDNTRNIEECGIPLDRVVRWNRRFFSCSREADHWINNNDHPYAAWGGAVTIHLLAMLGYRWVFCLGHSDREGKVPILYEGVRYGCECTADAVGDRYGCRVVFWMPDHTPENWRIHQNRGFLFGR